MCCASSSRVETRSHRAHIAQHAAVALLALQLGACVTTSSVPNSPFLTAVVRLNPLAPPPASTTNADAVSDAPKRRPTASGIAAQGGPATSHIEGADVEATGTVVPTIERKEVYPQLASASSRLATIAAPSAPQIAMPSAADAAAPKGRKILLGEAVGAAVISHPLMGAQAARVTGSLADVRTAQGALKPQLQVYAGSGGSYLGSYVNYPRRSATSPFPAAHDRMPDSPCGSCLRFRCGKGGHRAEQVAGRCRAPSSGGSGRRHRASDRQRLLQPAASRAS